MNVGITPAEETDNHKLNNVTLTCDDNIRNDHIDMLKTLPKLCRFDYWNAKNSCQTSYESCSLTHLLFQSHRGRTLVW